MHKRQGNNKPPVRQTNMLWSWWQGDPLSQLPALPGFTLTEATDPLSIEEIMHIATEESQKRLALGHRAYIANIDNQPAAYGWSAINQCSFGSPGMTFHIPSDNCYLYHFVTGLPWRGKSVYPHLLQAIIQHEQEAHSRFWIIHRQVNHASQRGITKAGFQFTGYLNNIADQGVALTPDHNTARMQAAANLLGVTLHMRNSEPEPGNRQGA